MSSEASSSPNPVGLKFDAGKLRFDLIPEGTEAALAAVMTFGAKKYAADSWQQVENGRGRYYAALRRHLDAWWTANERIDPESGLHHLVHALACVSFLLWIDTRKDTKCESQS